MASGRAPRAGAAEVRLMVATEERFRPASGYADRLVGAGAPITAWMRRDLIDWMIEVRPGEKEGGRAAERHGATRAESRGRKGGAAPGAV